MFDRYRQLLLERDGLKVSSFFDRLLDGRIVSARSGEPLLATRAGDLAIPSVTTLGRRVASLEQQVPPAEQRLKMSELKLLTRLSAAYERAQTAFTSARASLK